MQPWVCKGFAQTWAAHSLIKYADGEVNTVFAFAQVWAFELGTRGMGHGAWGMGHGAWGVGRMQGVRNLTSEAGRGSEPTP